MSQKQTPNLTKAPYEFWQEQHLAEKMTFAEFSSRIQAAKLTPDKFTSRNLEAVANGEYAPAPAPAPASESEPSTAAPKTETPEPATATNPTAERKVRK